MCLCGTGECLNPYYTGIDLHIEVIKKVGVEAVLILIILE